MEHHQATAKYLLISIIVRVKYLVGFIFDFFSLGKVWHLSGKILERLTPFAEHFQTLLNKIGWKSGQQKTPAFTGV
jgi:hypothetical protein